jgi:hypothetical protein
MIGMIAMIGFDRLCARKEPIGRPIGARIRTICARDCERPCTCADRPSQFLYMHMYTHTRNGLTDNPKQKARTLFHGHYFIDTDET